MVLLYKIVACHARGVFVSMEVSKEEPAVWRLPFNLYSQKRGGCFRLFSMLRRIGTGMCIQGNFGADTHTGELKFAFDFALPTGTPILASADGVVVASIGHHRHGGRGSNEMRVKANHIAIRHASGVYTRYYHLCHRGVSVCVGEQVARGAQIGRSGNTGYSGAPHLHWDVVDVFPTETATLALVKMHG